jgi:hypothetical protein
MNKIKITTTQLFVAVASMIFTLAALTITIRAQSTATGENNLFPSADLPTTEFDSTKFSFDYLATVNVANLEELYSAVNNPANAGNQIVIAPGFYMLSANAPGGASRPNGGRLELQENMSLKGVVGDRSAVIIEASSLPAASYAGTAPVTNTGVIRAGRGSNAIEWLTVRNASSGGAGVIVHLSAAGSAYVRIAHIASHNNPRGIDVRNVAVAPGTYAIELEIVDNDLYDNRRIATGAGIRIINNADGGASIFAALSGNRAYGNLFGIFSENLNSNGGNITIFSSGDRAFDNGTGIVVGGALGVSANGNTTNFTAVGTTVENNHRPNTFDRGGFIVLGGENTTNPNGMLNNTANVVLRNCRLANNQENNLKIFGARSSPATIGNPGTGNRANVRLFGTPVFNPQIEDTVPTNASAMNSATLIRSSVTPNSDFDGDGKADLSVFRPSDQTWYLNRVSGGFNAVRFGLATDKLVPADFDGDGKADIAVYRDGVWYWLNSSNNQFRAFQFGLPTDIPQPADFDGDGKSEIAVWRPSNAVWYIFNLATNQFTFFQLGNGADKPVVGDYDGDGLADYAVFRPSNGTWIVQRSTAGFVETSFGLSTDIPIPADYDGDGKIDFAVFRPSEGNWYLRRSTDGNTQIINWGLATDALVPADYDGDGKADVAVFRNGIWHIHQSSGGSNAFYFGSSGDVPTNQIQ